MIAHILGARSGSRHAKYTGGERALVAQFRILVRPGPEMVKAAAGRPVRRP
jgi:hypothetical protein